MNKTGEFPAPMELMLSSLIIPYNAYIAILNKNCLFTESQNDPPFKKIFTYLFAGKRGRKKGDKYQCQRCQLVASLTPPNGNLAHNPGMCPNWESNQQPFGSQAATPARAKKILL